jgi:hypothetical protein
MDMRRCGKAVPGLARALRSSSSAVWQVRFENIRELQLERSITLREVFRQRFQQTVRGTTSWHSVKQF